MDVLYQSCAGIDVHQANIVVCILHGPLTSTRPKREMATFDTMTKGLRACHDFLSQFRVLFFQMACPSSCATIDICDMVTLCV